MGLRLGLVGLGAFGKEFAPLFRKHPGVDRIALCDREPDRLQPYVDAPEWHEKFAPARDAFTSFDELCAADLDAIALFTQPWLHAPQALKALEFGKHVYSAVPIVCLPDGDEILTWCDRLVDTVRSTGKRYMLGETTFFRPEAMFCRRRAAAGDFGDFVYAEGEYLHDVDHGLREVQRRRKTGRAGREWAEQSRSYREQGARNGPMHYPTHSTCGPVCVMNTHARRVTAYGYANANDDPFFRNNAFSNEVALFEMANGASVRICEFREVGQAGRETFRIYGTRGSFENGHWQSNGRTSPDDARPLVVETPDPEHMRDPLPEPVLNAWRAPDGTIPYGGHGGSHAYLVHEFVDAALHDRHPAVNVWEACRYMAMGVVAHQSALRNGERLPVPDWGDAPDDTHEDTP